MKTDERIEALLNRAGWIGRKIGPKDEALQKDASSAESAYSHDARLEG